MHYMEYRAPSALEQIQRILAIPAKKADTRLVRHLTAQEMQSILDAPDPTIRDGIRDRAMLHLCFAGGLRVSELVGLRMEKRHPLSVPGYPCGVQFGFQSYSSMPAMTS
jgi:site-specific recombinase XerD